MEKPEIRAYFDDATNTVSYLVRDPASRQAVIIDPVLDWDHRSGTADTASADRILAEAKALNLDLQWVLETHVHADHLTAASYIRARKGVPVGIGEHVKDVQAIFAPLFDARDVARDGADFDRLFHDGEKIRVGGMEIEVMYLPGHTPADVAYRIGEDVFVGDTIFMPDYGTARADFPGADPRLLYRSIRRLLDLPPQTRLWMCHDYKAPGRDTYAWQTTVAAERAANPHVKDGISEEQFVAFRKKRDAGLAAPTLLLPSIQVNIRAGRFPDPESNGTRYLRIPVKLKGKLTPVS